LGRFWRNKRRRIRKGKAIKLLRPFEIEFYIEKEYFESSYLAAIKNLTL